MDSYSVSDETGNMDTAMPLNRATLRSVAKASIIVVVDMPTEKGRVHGERGGHSAGGERR